MVCLVTRCVSRRGMHGRVNRGVVKPDKSHKVKSGPITAIIYYCHYLLSASHLKCRTIVGVSRVPEEMINGA